MQGGGWCVGGADGGGEVRCHEGARHVLRGLFKIVDRSKCNNANQGKGIVRRQNKAEPLDAFLPETVAAFPPGVSAMATKVAHKRVS
jgi:hypothetical protein